MLREHRFAIQIRSKRLIIINVHYETEPPHGDGIYSVTLKNKKLPFWIYGRNVVFIAENKLSKKWYYEIYGTTDK